MLATVGDPGIEQGERFGVEGNHSFGPELAERDAQLRAVSAEVNDAVRLEVQQLTGTHPGGAQQG